MKAPYAQLLLLAFLLAADICGAHEKIPRKDVSIGVLSYRGVDESLNRWNPTADYLTKKIPAYKFHILPLNLLEMATAIKSEEVQFIVTNPGHYVELESQFGISRIATKQTMHDGIISTRFGSVIISRANNSSITTLQDLRGKSFMAVSKDAFGGFQMSWRELVEHDIDPFSDFSSIKFVGFPQDQVVTAVYTGEVDAAAVRSETLLHMVEETEFELSEFRILNLQPAQHEDLPSSTRLYPQGPFAQNKSTPRELATKVTIALLDMPIDHPAAAKSHGAGWTVPLDYSSVHELMKRLHIGPYLSLRESTLQGLLKKYAAWIVVATLFMVFLMGLTIYIYNTNRRLQESDRRLRREITIREHSQEELVDYKNSLERRIIARTNEIELVNASLKKSQTVLRKLVYITSSAQLGHEEKMVRLLETGREYYKTGAARLSNLSDQGIKASVVSAKVELLENHVGPLNSLGVQQVSTQHDVPLDIPNLNTKNYKSPGCGCDTLNSYLASAVIVRGETHSVLEFSDEEVRKNSYTHWDHNLLQVMARWIGSEIEMQDIVEETQRNQTELARVGRVSVMGEMAAGLAHELNQPLTGAINYSSGCLRRLKSDTFDKEKIIQGLERAVESATMAADIIRHLREFTQKGGINKDIVALNEVVIKIVKLIATEIKRHQTSITLQLSPNLPDIVANETQLEQVILNFIRNSLDAMDNIDVEKREIIITTDQSLDKVRLFVIDFGNGIKSNAELNLFDAFYTTKSEGMGLGLSISRTIIEEHNGTITASNNPDGGACFSFELPALRTNNAERFEYTEHLEHAEAVL